MDIAAKFTGRSSACSQANIITLQKIVAEAAIFSGSKNLAQFANQTTVRCFGKDKDFHIKKTLSCCVGSDIFLRNCFPVTLTTLFFFKVGVMYSTPRFTAGEK